MEAVAVRSHAHAGQGEIISIDAAENDMVDQINDVMVNDHVELVY